MAQVIRILLLVVVVAIGIWLIAWQNANPCPTGQVRVKGPNPLEYPMGVCVVLGDN